MILLDILEYVWVALSARNVILDKLISCIWWNIFAIVDKIYCKGTSIYCTEYLLHVKTTILWGQSLWPYNVFVWKLEFQIPGYRIIDRRYVIFDTGSGQLKFPVCDHKHSTCLLYNYVDCVRLYLRNNANCLCPGLERTLYIYTDNP